MYITTCVYAKNYMSITNNKNIFNIISKYIKVHINNEVIYLNPAFIVGLEPYKDCETILHLSYPYYTKTKLRASWDDALAAGESRKKLSSV